MREETRYWRNLIMRRVAGGFLAVFVGAVLPVAAQTQEAPGPELEVERGGHPLYGEPQPEPIKPEPVILTPELFPAEFDPGETRTTGSLLDLAVFLEGNEALGQIEDVVVDLERGRVAYLMVRPEAEFGQEPTVGYAVSPEALAVENGHLYLTVSLEEAEAGPVLTEAGLRVVAETANRLPPVAMVERAAAVAAEFGQPQQARQEIAREGELPADREEVVPPEVRGGVPPEHRGGIPPEVRTPVPSNTGLDPAGPTNASEAGR